MRLKIRSKVLLGVLFLFIEFVTIGGLSMYYISYLKYSSELMNRNNYRSVQYAENMIRTLDDIQGNINGVLLHKEYQQNTGNSETLCKHFDEQLVSEENNITELGEKELTQSIRSNFEKLKSILTNQQLEKTQDKVNYFAVNIAPVVAELRNQIFEVSRMNLQSIAQKNEALKERVGHIYKIISVVLTLCFLLAFSFIINFPTYIATPLKKITEGVKEMAATGFKNRIHYSSTDEFGQLADAINKMADELEQRSSLKPQEVVVKENIPDDQLLLANIHSVLESIRPLLSTLADHNNNELLRQQAEVLKKVEQELSKSIV